MTIRALVFDAYGTLYDVRSVQAKAEQLCPGRGEVITQVWRLKQLEYTWLRSLLQQYEDFWEVTRASLDFALRAAGVEPNDAVCGPLMENYLHLDPYPEAGNALVALGGRRLAILSNGAPAMLDALVANSGLARLFAAVLSVDELKIYKPTPKVYQLAVDRLGVPAQAIGFVSSNCWDAAGARSFGFRTFWVNRGGLPVDDLGFAPDHEVRSLAELPALVG